MNKLYFTFKPLGAVNNFRSFGGLCSLDLSTGKVIQKLVIPAAAFHAKNEAFMSPAVSGLDIDFEKNIAYVGVWNFIVVIDLVDFKILDSFSYPEFSDIHSIKISENELFVVCTASECVVCLDRFSLEKKWVWGGDAKILEESAIPFLPSLKSQKIYGLINRFGLRKIFLTPKLAGVETRHVHKKNSPYYRHHLNNITVKGDFLYLNTKGWYNAEKSSVICLSVSDFTSGFFVEPGGFIGSHDGNFYEDFYYVTEANNNSMARKNLKTGIIERFNITPENYFVRGLSKGGSYWYVGFTPMKGDQRPTGIAEICEKTFSTNRLLTLPNLCGDDIQVAVHDVIFSGYV